MFPVAKNERADEDSTSLLAQDRKPHRRGVRCTAERVPRQPRGVLALCDQAGGEQLSAGRDLSALSFDEEPTHDI